MKLEGKTFVITGGAAGLGRAAARLFVAEGANIVILDIDKEGGFKLEKELSPNAIFICCDVTEENEVQFALDKGIETFSYIHGCINCAGGGIMERTVEILKENDNIVAHSLDTFKRVISLNLIGTFNVLRLCAKQMIRNKPMDDNERGIIINIASIAAYDGQRGQAAYTASKSAIVGMTLPIARDLGNFGIRIVTIAPALMNTERIQKARLKRPAGWGERMIESNSFPKRIGDPNKDFAPICKHIVENIYLNGEIIRLDAGCRKKPI
eukprot:116954_1